jgi:ArsR family transcriptional regulator
VKDVSIFFKALGDEVRVKMLWLLLHHQELCVCDFMEVLQIPQSRASRHLRTLLHAGLVTDRREGLWAYYALRSPLERLAEEHLQALRRSLASRKDARELLGCCSVWLKRKGRVRRCP